MSREVKAAAERRAELLDVAGGLFAKHGYEATTVSRILAAVGLSTGAFYHHFRSKEELLAGLVERMAEVSLATVEQLAGANVSATEKLHQFFHRTEERKRRVAGEANLRRLAKALYHPKNLRVRVALEDASFALALPVLTQVLREGVEAQEFDCADPARTAKMILHLGTTTIREAMRDDPAQVAEELYAYRRAVERLVGLKEGVLE
ncbi:MAG: TetR/AcrR family transcriptional regulator [Myxococcota bacterium]